MQSEGCDHTTRFASRWAEQNQVPWQDLQDALDQASVFCDCEIVLNLDEGQPLFLEQDKLVAPLENRWLLPPNFHSTITKVEKILVGRAGIGKNNHVSEGEWLIPAPVDAVPRRRIRKLVHFFIGLQTGLPTEIAFVESIEPISLNDFAARICGSPVQESNTLPLQVAAFITQKISQLPVGTCVGTDMLVQQHVRLFPSNRLNRRFTCASLPRSLSLQFQVFPVALNVDGIRVEHAAWQAEDIANFQGALKPLATNDACGLQCGKRWKAGWLPLGR